WRPACLSICTVVFIYSLVSFVTILLQFPRLHHLASLLLGAGLAWQTARLVARQPDRALAVVRNSRRQVLASCAAVLGALVAGAFAQKERNRRREWRRMA